ncbi:MAG: 1,3,6,8-tetrahydroxynaphthalene synthase [Pseudomonadota bacterium]|jgi:alkylresorcinol/alkylpyrone synthase
MPSIIAVESALPPFRYEIDGVAAAGARWLQSSPEAAKLFERFLRSSETGSRNFSFDLREVLELKGLKKRGELFEEFAPILGAQALSAALQQARLPATAVASLVFTSCSCPSIPSVDALVVERVGLSRSVGRLPVYQHGCAGGVIGLELACDLAKTRGVVACTAVELCSLVFQPQNNRPAQLVGSAIFADGAAAAIVSPDERGLVYLDHQSSLLPNTRHLMGYDIFDDGFHLRLDRDLPQALADVTPGLVGEFLGRHGLESTDVHYWLFHPGGVKILDFLERSFGLHGDQSRWSREVLRTVGNLSSATILFVLKAFLESKVAVPGDKVLMMGIGPGLTIELILFEWVPR